MNPRKLSLGRLGVSVCLVLLAIACRTHPESTLAERLRTRLATAHADWNVVVRDASSVDVNLPGDMKMQLSLDNVRAACSHGPAECDGALEQLARAVEDSVARVGTPEKAAPESLRILVRNGAYLEAMAKGNAEVPPEKRAENALIEKPLVGGLHAIVAVDAKESRTMLTRARLGELGLDADAAYARALENFRGLAPALEGEATDSGVFIVDPDDDDTASLLLLPEKWKPIAAKFEGKLLVAAPARRVLLYVDARAPNAEKSLRALATRMSEELDHPISATVLRWSPEGWSALASE